MHNLHIINYSDFTADELCHYLEDRHYMQILTDMESIQKYLENLSCNEENDLIELVNVIFHKLNVEVKQLFSKDKILLFPHLKKNVETPICLTPVNLLHQRINAILQQLRKLMNNYVQQPAWSNQFKICCNELFTLEQSIQHVLYIKENFLWTKINTITSNEC
ncbi:MAG TPA: hypothetical protein PLS10_14600 [Chitinophagales bacterium]|nr:hypothetical protein [Chitinophagales bacterium]